MPSKDRTSLPTKIAFAVAKAMEQIDDRLTKEASVPFMMEERPMTKQERLIQQAHEAVTNDTMG